MSREFGPYAPRERQRDTERLTLPVTLDIVERCGVCQNGSPHEGTKIMIQTETIRPTLGEVRHVGTMADRRAYRVMVTYPGENGRVVAFNGPATEYGPVVMLTETWPDGIHVADPSRFGPFGPQWVRRFFGND